MAKTARPRIGGGKLALFEVLQTKGGPDAAPTPDGPVPSKSADVAPPPAPARSQATSTPGAMPTHSFNSAAASHAASHQPPRRDGGFDAGAARGGINAGGLGLIVGGVGVVGILTLAFLAGRLTADPVADGGPALDEPMPEVLGVGGQPVLRTQTPLPRAAPASNETVIAGTAAKTAPVALPTSVKRVAGMNYVLVQSYATSERHRAEATVAALHQAGIGATIETNIKGWPNKLCVFGTESFEYQKNNPKYQQYLADLQRVSRTASQDKLIKRFDPLPVQWGR